MNWQIFSQKKLNVANQNSYVVNVLQGFKSEHIE